ncbi:AfsR-like transcriptional regulator TcrA [Streptomyces plumbiresistens]|uniref:AfsR-like transcriptional regulator TcrA n=2 Tax=Streptomyces plumbiresistens TaxID=511811 RepID=A0ABP7Q792_9ACTN
MGGIGKTALALEAAHRARAQGWFPGGTLFVDLRGYDDDPVTADQAVLALLDALGIRSQELPPTTERQYDAYRGLLAERRDRMLLILDNASDPSQYLPLLPGMDHHRVLITSRDRPDALPVRLVNLEALDPTDSATLVTRGLHDTDDRDDRPCREPEALHELNALCGHLPLALQIVAGLLRRRRFRDIASLVAELRNAGDPTAVLDRGSPGTDLYGRPLVLRPVLEASYRRLPPDQARLLRLLALAPSAETGTEAVASLTDLDLDAAQDLLEDLAAASLVTPVPTGDDLRWRLHDLVRAFGVGVVAGDAGLQEEGEEARERLLEFYWRWAYAANARFQWRPGMPEPERFTDRAQALAWLDQERTGLVAAVQWASEERYVQGAVGLATCLVEYLLWRRYNDDGITVALASREATYHAGDQDGEANSWNGLGAALRAAGRADEAIDAHTCARDLYQSLGNRNGEAIAWDNLGRSMVEAGRAEEAMDAHTCARNLYQSLGNRNGEAIAWTGLGLALRVSGRAEEAIEAHTHARDLHQSLGDRNGEGIAWNTLGLALREAGRTEEAIDAYGRALERHREFEDWYLTGQTLCNLAVVHEDIRQPTEARAYYLNACDAFTRADASTEAAKALTRAEGVG